MLAAADVPPAATPPTDNTAATPVQPKPKPLSIHVQPFDGCQVWPEGASNDSTRAAFITADSTGVARFYPPPSAWGSKLVFTCGPNGDPKSSHVVNLNDTSTFSQEPDSFAGPGVVGKRPALTSDQLSMSPADLLAGGYPPRPDSAKNPDGYAKWLQVVTRSFDIISSAGVADFGAKAASFDGRYGGAGINGPVPWTGLIQDTAGFTGVTDTNYQGGFPLAASAANYSLYFVYMYNIPTSCPANYLCSTSFWGGLGGYPVNFFNSPFLTPLIQSGVWNGSLFYEYVNSNNLGPPSWVTLGAGQTLAPCDEVLVEGWAASGPSCQESRNGAYGCFAFWDLTRGCLLVLAAYSCSCRAAAVISFWGQLQSG